MNEPISEIPVKKPEGTLVSKIFKKEPTAIDKVTDAAQKDEARKREAHKERVKLELEAMKKRHDVALGKVDDELALKRQTRDDEQAINDDMAA